MSYLVNILVLYFFAIVYSYVATSDDGLVILLAKPKSKIRGHIQKSEEGLNFYAFQQIPYASPPIGKLRFEEPRKINGWNGILNATKNTKVCPQTIPTALPQDEDCLYLNVYTPAKPNANEKLAVYVWIQGGAYYFWDSTIYRYGPKYFMDYNIVVVTINYRLGAFGFLTENCMIPANIGLRDQRLALIWVQENIHIFGGDPTQVTIGGESAGASSVSMHVLSPQSKGLFRGAIQQTGSALCSFNYQPKAYHYAFELGRHLDNNLKDGDSYKLLEILRKATFTEILEAQKKVINRAQWIAVIPDIIWAPVIETTLKKSEAFLSEPMHDMFINGKFNKVAMLLGFTSEEMLWFLPGTKYNKISDFIIGLDKLDKVMANLDEDSSRLINNEFNILDRDKGEAGSLLKKVYTNTTFLTDKPAYISFTGDIYFRQGTSRQAQLASNFISKVFLYQFSYTPYTNKTITEGAEHTEELQYMWQNIKEDPGFVNNFQKILQRQMLKLWTNFIKYLNPTPIMDDELCNTIWPSVDPKKMQYLNINQTLTIKTNPRNYFQIGNIYNNFMKPPFIVY